MFFSDLLFNNQEFASALYNSLNENGIFIAQTGMASAIDDPSTLNTRDKHGHLFKERLSEAGFEHIREYEDVSRRGNCQFGSECQLSVLWPSLTHNLYNPVSSYLYRRTADLWVFGVSLLPLKALQRRSGGTPMKLRLI